METLDKALSRIWETEWRHMRSGETLKSQAWSAIRALGAFRKVTEVDQEAVQLVTSEWYEEGLSPATITKRLNCLSKLGVSVEGCRVKVPKGLKWYLKESDKPKVLEWCREQDCAYMADFIEWTTLTGFRIEESMRLRWADLDDDYTQVSVPGMKTGASQATLPIGPQVAAVLERVRAPYAHGWWTNNETPPYRVFPSDYVVLNDNWQAIRHAFGWQDDPTATLKALRRSAARYLHVDCGMPLHMVQQYLRHESMDTTLEYLRLTGGYGTEEMRRYLK